MKTGIRVLYFIATSWAWGQSLEWDTNLVTPGPQGGSGDWDGGNFWWNGSTNVPWVSGADAIFGGSAGTVDSSGITVDDISYTVTGYNLTGPSGNLTLGGGDGVSVISGTQNMTINAAVAGSSNITKQGLGILTLNSPASTFTGGITIEQGGVVAAAVMNEGTASSLGSGGLITLGGVSTPGTLYLPRSSVSTNRPFFINSGGGSIDPGLGNTAPLALSGPISGSGPLSFTQTSGEVTIQGDKTYSGTLTATSILTHGFRLAGSMPAADFIIQGGSTVLFRDGNASQVTIADLLCDHASWSLLQRLNATSLDLNASDVYVYLGSSAYDSTIDVTGPVTLRGSNTLGLTLLGPRPAVGTIFRLIENDGTDPVTLNGHFVYGGKVLEEGQRFIAGGLNATEFEIRYGLTADDNDVRVIATGVPEPSIGLLAFGGIAVGFSRSRFGRCPLHGAFEAASSRT